jgi:hypothetical protein
VAEKKKHRVLIEGHTPPPPRVTRFGHSPPAPPVVRREVPIKSQVKSKAPPPAPPKKSK